MRDTEQILQTMIERIESVARPERVILFGSRARGDARENSDFDLLVIAESHEPRYRRAAPLYAVLAGVPVEADVLVYTPTEVAEWSAVPQAFVTTAIREGRVLYERSDRSHSRLVAESTK